MNHETLNEEIDYIVKQFLYNVPIHKFIWNNLLENLTYELQEILINKTVNSKLNTNYPVKISYQKAFLKHLIEALEKQGSEVHDDLYSAYGRLVALQSGNESFKHYSIDGGTSIISLKENIHLLTNGTCGLRTWQAALVLAEWSLSNPEVFKNNIVLELGSGVGLTGLVITLQCSPGYMYFTDCHSSVLKVLSDNVKLNIAEKRRASIGDSSTLDASRKLELLQDRCVYHNLGKSNVFVLNLPWQDVNKETCMKLGTINKVIAADILYDSELFDPLISALNCLASLCSVDEFIFSCTVRNEKTLDEFIQRMSEAPFFIEHLPIPPQKKFIWQTEAPERLFRFTTK